MRIAAQTGRTQGTIESVEDIRMSMDEDATAFLMASISTSLYADGNRAALREYTSNALDSHARAGQDRPVEVTLPTTLNPVLTVQDWGVGLSLEDIRTMFSKFGGSDKRGSNGERGGFGLGSKSGLAVSPQYTFVAVKDGEKSTVLVSRGEDFIPVMKVLSTEATTEHNGVTIQIPVAEPHRMLSCAGDLFLTVEPGRLLVDGKPPARTIHDTEHYLRVEENGELLGWWSRSTVNRIRRGLGVDVLGVHYPAPDNIERDYEWEPWRTMLSLPNGSVGFSTSRDSLLPTPATKRAIEERLARFQAAVTRHYVDTAAAAKCAREAVAAAAQAPRAALPLSWRGEIVPTHRTALQSPSTQLGANRGTSGEVSNISVTADFVYVQVDETMHDKALNAGRVIRTAANRNSEGWTTMLFATEPLSAQSEWVRAVCTERSLDTLLEQAREARRSNAPRTPRTRSVQGVRVFTSQGKTEPCPVAELPEKVCYLHVSEAGVFGSALPMRETSGIPSGARALLRLLNERGWSVVRLGARQNPQKMLPEARSVDAVMDEVIAEVIESGAEFRDWLALTQSSLGMTMSTLTRAGVLPADIEDEALADALSTYQDTPSSDLLSRVIDICAHDERLVDFLKAAPKYENTYEFPLLNYSYRVSREHIVGYVNAVVAGLI